MAYVPARHLTFFPDALNLAFNGAKIATGTKCRYTEQTMSNEYDGLPLASLRAGQRIDVTNITRDLVLARALKLAFNPWHRFRGLIGRPALNTGEGMLLRPCRSVHSFFMSRTIDVVFLTEDGKVVSCIELRPWRFSALHMNALATLELPESTIAKSGTSVGDRVVFRSSV